MDFYSVFKFHVTWIHLACSINIDQSSLTDLTSLSDDNTQEDLCASGDLLACSQAEFHGEYEWNEADFRQLYDLIIAEMNVKAEPNWSSGNILTMGYVGLAFTPEQLGTSLKNVDDDVYNAFGDVDGWAPDQSKALASRYLTDKGIQPDDLTTADLGILNHLVCGFTRQEVGRIKAEAIRDAMSLLGKMKRCENIEVLTELAQKLKDVYGPVSSWSEAVYGDFGIILAGLNGDELKSLGTPLANHVKVPFIKYVEPEEIGKLDPSQTALFSYEVALEASKRGLCPWLYPSQKLGQFQAVCG